jgi:zinc/manganese transport system substrate-binding protein
MAELTRQLAEEFSRRLPTAAPHIAANLSRTQEGLRSIDRKSEEIAHLYQAAPVIVTDQLARDFVAPLRFRTQGEASPRNAPRASASSAASLAALQDAIQRHEGGILVYDQSTATTAIKDLVAAAHDAGIPVLGLRQSLPNGLHYQQWMLRQLNALHGALNEAAP